MRSWATQEDLHNGAKWLEARGVAVVEHGSAEKEGIAQAAHVPYTLWARANANGTEVGVEGARRKKEAVRRGYVLNDEDYNSMGACARDRVGSQCHFRACVRTCVYISVYTSHICEYVIYRDVRVYARLARDPPPRTHHVSHARALDLQCGPSLRRPARGAASARRFSPPRCLSLS